MLSHCPHCHNELKLNEAQQEKVRQALAALPAGKSLKLTCPICKEPIHLGADGQPLVAAGGGPGAGQPEAEPPSAGAPAAAKPAAAPPPKPVNPPPVAPGPPDIGWLQSGAAVEGAEAVVKDVPLALVLIQAGGPRQPVQEALEGMGYQVEFPASAAAAKERMRFVNFAAVVLHSGFEGGALADSVFHQHMRKLPMSSRRLMLYILLGPDFHTLYDLEALALSANLVVNDRDLAKMGVILQKASYDYQALFGPYLEALRGHGKLG